VVTVLFCYSERYQDQTDRPEAEQPSNTNMEKPGGKLKSDTG